MNTTIQETYRSRLQAADQERRNREFREQAQRVGHRPVPHTLYRRVCVLCCSAAVLLFLAMVAAVLRLVYGVAI